MATSAWANGSANRERSWKSWASEAKSTPATWLASCGMTPHWTRPPFSAGDLTFPAARCNRTDPGSASRGRRIPSSDRRPFLGAKPWPKTPLRGLTSNQPGLMPKDTRQACSGQTAALGAIRWRRAVALLAKKGASPYAPAERDGAKDASMCLDETASMPANHPIKSDRPVKSEETGRVLRFEPRRSSNWPRPFSAAPLRPPAELVEIQSRGAEQEEYRHRMR